MNASRILIVGLALGLALPQAGHAEPGGCLKYGAAGAVGGHFAHHGVLGALGGCAAGMYTRHRARVEAERQRTEQLNEASHRGGRDEVDRYRQQAEPLPPDPYEGRHHPREDYGDNGYNNRDNGGQRY